MSTFCGHCGSPLRAGQRHCGTCGADVSTWDPQTHPAAPAGGPPTPAGLPADDDFSATVLRTSWDPPPPVRDQPAADPAGSGPAWAATDRPVLSESDRRGPVLPVVLAGVVALLVAAVAMIWFIRGGSGPSTTPSTVVAGPAAGSTPGPAAASATASVATVTVKETVPAPAPVTVTIPATPAPAPIPQPQAADRCVDLRWKEGNRNVCVNDLQALHNYHASRVGGTGLLVDGYFGPKTDAGIRALQRNLGLVVDGVVGPQTWAALCSTYTGATVPSDFPLAQARHAGCPGADYWHY